MRWPSCSAMIATLLNSTRADGVENRAKNTPVTSAVSSDAEEALDRDDHVRERVVGAR